MGRGSISSINGNNQLKPWLWTKNSQGARVAAYKILREMKGGKGR